MGLLSFLFGCGKNSPEGQDPSEANAAESSVQDQDQEDSYEIADIYTGLRDQVLSLTPGDINLQADPQQPIALLMETGYEGAAVTLVCIADGTTSLYFSNGGGTIGAGEHDAVKRVNEKLILGLEKSLDNFKPTKNYPLPQPGQTVFYAVTSDGVIASEFIAEDDLGNQRHHLSPLFFLAQDVITQIRLNSPN